MYLPDGKMATIRLITRMALEPTGATRYNFPPRGPCFPLHNCSSTARGPRGTPLTLVHQNHFHQGHFHIYLRQLIPPRCSQRGSQCYDRSSVDTPEVSKILARSNTLRESQSRQKVQVKSSHYINNRQPITGSLSTQHVGSTVPNGRHM